MWRSRFKEEEVVSVAAKIIILFTISAPGFRNVRYLRGGTDELFVVEAQCLLARHIALH
jgi:hypothetical protein